MHFLQYSCYQRGWCFAVEAVVGFGRNQSLLLVVVEVVAVEAAQRHCL